MTMSKSTPLFNAVSSRQHLATALISTVATASIILLTGAKAPTQKFDEIDVGRINVREPDGTLRMVIANRAQFPGSPWKGKEVARPDRKDFAGMLFMNDEGTENGGLIQKGVIDKNGKASAGVSLTFDRFRQDQAMQLLHAEEGGRAFSFLAINDETDGMQFDVMQRAEKIKAIQKMDEPAANAEMQKLFDEQKLSRNRIRLGTTMDGAAALSLADGKGRPRMMFLVSKDGAPVIQMIGDQGRVEKTIQLDSAVEKNSAKDTSKKVKE
jgi:hypothetical protein